jgi:hypothetical protein
MNEYMIQNNCGCCDSPKIIESRAKILGTCFRCEEFARLSNHSAHKRGDKYLHYQWLSCSKHSIFDAEKNFTEEEKEKFCIGMSFTADRILPEEPRVPWYMRWFS